MANTARRAAQPKESNELKVLLNNKEYLASMLSSVKLLKLADNLNQNMIISSDVNGIFQSLDSNMLDSKLRARYLLQHIYESVKYDDILFHRFLQILDSCEEKLSKYLKWELWELSWFERRAVSKYQAVVDEIGSKVVVDDIYLSKDDVPILMETLVEVSNRWEEIGITLGLPRLTISKCRSSSDTVSLTNILREWISNDKKDTTLNKLKLALDGRLVGRSSFAPLMEEKFREVKSAEMLVAKKQLSGSEDQSCDEAVACVTVSTAKPPEELDEIKLSLLDVSILTELLVVCAHKWRPIGMSLGLPLSKIKKLEVKCSTSEADILCLRDVLFVWLTDGHQTTQRATLKNLKLALESTSVGLCTAASFLEKRFIKDQREGKSRSEAPAAKRPHLDSTLAIVRQHREVEVADGTSALLDVQVNLNESVSYEWMKDGHSLSDDQAYCGSCTDMLVVRLVCQGSEGEFSCRVRKGSEEVISEAIALTIIFPPEKKHLLNLYSKRGEIPKELWPIVDASTFIDLTLLKKNKFGYDHSDYSVKGDVVDTLKTKEAVEYAEVFGKFKRSSLTLVEGRPGSGKTALIHKVARDWAITGDVLKGAKMVFHIPLQMLAHRKDETLSDIFAIFHWSKEELERVLSDLHNSQGKNVCFILDGLDSFHPEDEKNSIVYSLYRRVRFPATMVIVSSCPMAPISITRGSSVTTRIEVIGFIKKQVFEYIEKFPFSADVSNNDTSSSSLKAYLGSHLNVLNMCYLPVHVSMLCFLYEHEKVDIPRTETEIYEHLTRFFLLRKLRRTNKKALLHSLEEISGEDEDYFKKVCHLAFDMSIHSKQVILRNSTEVRFPPSAPYAPPTFGLITSDKATTLLGYEKRYCFLHLTFQNYLAAFYMSNLEEDKQMEMIRLHAGEQNMQMVWKFYCGIVNFENKKAQVQQIMASADSLHRVQCAYESRQHVVCDSVLEFGRSSVIDLHAVSLTPADLAALGYVISTTSHPVTKLVMKGCDLHDDHVKAFMGEVGSNKMMCMQTLDLSCNNIGNEGAAVLAGGLKCCNNLSLHLSDNDIGVEGTEALASLECCVHHD